jgi:molecular chaperone DnaK
MTMTVPTSLGIDLGTTNCVAATVDAAGIPRSVVNFEGDILTPSAILLEDERRLLVGREAVKSAVHHPEAFATCFKRDMGQESKRISLNGQAHRPEFLSAVMLLRLKRDFERALGAARETVITVPAYFDEARRRSTINAGQIAGWEVTDIINEPTAAALTYARQHDAELATTDTLRRVLVYDLGGGTFDCTLLEITPKREYRTLATDGEVRLGGLDWDERLAQHLVELFERKTGSKPPSTPATQATLLRVARQLKHLLTTKTSADAPVTLGGQRALLEVTRETFQALTRDLLERTRATTRLVLEAGKCTWSQVHAIVLVGGSSRMPMVSSMLGEDSGRSPEVSPVIDEAVAHGAAAYAHLLNTKSPVRIINVNSHSLRVVGKRGQTRATSLLIPHNSPLPAARTKVYPLARTNQSSVTIEICEGPSEEPELCESIGMVQITDLPPARDGKPWKVAVTLEYRPDGSVAVSGKLVHPEDPTRIVKEVNTVLTPTRGLSPAEVASLRKTLSQYEVR